MRGLFGIAAFLVGAIRVLLAEVLLVGNYFAVGIQDPFRLRPGSKLDEDGRTVKYGPECRVTLDGCGDLDMVVTQRPSFEGINSNPTWDYFEAREHTVDLHVVQHR
jgi:hypothetical protein